MEPIVALAFRQDLCNLVKLWLLSSCGQPVVDYPQRPSQNQQPTKDQKLVSDGHLQQPNLNITQSVS